MKTKSIVLFFFCSFLLSFNGSAQWSVIDSLENGNLYSIHFVNADTGFAFHEFGTLRRTIDAGVTWDSIAIPFQGYVYDYDFPSSNVGYAVGGAWFPFGTYYGNTIMKTLDGGTTWDSVFGNYNFGVFNSVAAISDNEFFAVGTHGVMHSADGGNTLDTVFLATSPFANMYLRVRFTDAGTGYILANESTVSGYVFNLFRTTDGGQNWQSIYSDTLSASARDFVFTDAGNGMLTGAKGEVIVTTNNGTSWQTLSLPDTSLLFTLLETISGEVYAVAYNQADTTSRLYRSEDWGLNWQEEISFPSVLAYIVDISIPTPGTGYFTTYDRIFKNSNLVSLAEKNHTGFQLYPNPATDEVFIRLEDPSPAGITLYDNTGRKVATSSSGQEESFRLNINHLSPGIFLLEIRQKGQHFYRKLIKE